ncbi:MAG: hypothetical protein HQK99_02460 [Nitrospirae bacterium]|nr:hypothetical protein [Nitrospirota bacterium]
MTGVTFLIVSLLSGLVIERLFVFSENFWVRLSFSIITGTLISTWFVFILSYFMGFNKMAVVISIVSMALFDLSYRGRLSVRGASYMISLSHALIIAAIMPFFVFGLWEAADGSIKFLGNYVDISYHMSMVSSFVNNMAFPPGNPQSAGEVLRYHYLVNFQSAVLHMGGFSLYWSVQIPQLMFSFALTGLLYHFYKIILEEEGRIVFSALFFIGGHIGCFNVSFSAAGFPAPDTVFDITSWSSVREQMLHFFLNFLDITTNYFQPQRPFLFGFPASLIILSALYETLVRQNEIDHRRLFGVAFLTGLLPLFHIHSFLVVCPVVCLAALYMCPERKRTLMALWPVLLGVVQILLMMSGQRSAAYSGFDVHKLGGGINQMMVLNSAIIARLLFWIRAAGPALIFGSVSAYYYFKKNRDFSFISGSKNIFLMVFIIIDVFYFIAINFYRFTPNWGDSNKFFLYFALCLSIFMGNLSWTIFKKKSITAKAAIIALILLSGVLPMAVEDYGIFTRPYSVLFSACDRKAAEWIRGNTPVKAVFLTDNGMVHFVPSLTGRAVVDGAYNHETGSERPGREDAIGKIFSTGDYDLIKRYNIDFIVVSRYERGRFAVNDRAFNVYHKVYDDTCRGENYKIYETNGRSTEAANRRQPKFSR